MEVVDGFGIGFLGGIFAELLGLFRLRQFSPEEFPVWFRTWTYWIITLSMAAAGGVLVVIYIKTGIELKALLALNVGASAPLILGSLVNNAPSSSRVN